MKDWNVLDMFIASFRYNVVNKYVMNCIGGVIADIGCGREGTFLKSHASKIGHGYGFDFRIVTHDEGNISLINNKELNGKIPLDSGSVDAVFLNAVLEHLESPVDVISEAARILRTGGKIIMTTPTRIAKPVLEFLAYKMHLINEDEIREHKHYFNKADVLELIKAVNSSDLGISLILERYSFFELGFNSLIVLQKK